MRKQWDGEIRLVTIIEKSSGEKESSFLADNVVYCNGINTFYLDGNEVNFYRDTECYHTSKKY
ncbi:hypothetical protein [Clostridium sp.]|uniref:hypothetical protein n=1 Tax=Clostridium sp. TaxID=1506 RepID=UPI003216EA30